MSVATPILLPSQRGIKYANAPIILDLADNELFDLGEPTELPVYSENPETEDISYVKYGASTPSGFRRTAIRPTFTFTPPFPTVGSIALARGKKMAVNNADVAVYAHPFLIEAETMDIGGTNVNGDGVGDDVANQLGWFVSATDALPVVANNVAFAGAPAAGEFGQGAGLNFKFNAADVGKVFYWYAPARGTAIDVVEANETVIDNVRIIQEYVTVDNTIKVIDGIFKVVPNGDILGGTQELLFLSVSDPTQCAIGARIYELPLDQLFFEKC